MTPPPKSEGKFNLPESPKSQLEDWSKDVQSHEQVAIGQARGRSEAQMQTFLDEIEKNIEGQKKTKDRET